MTKSPETNDCNERKRREEEKYQLLRRIILRWEPWAGVLCGGVLFGIGAGLLEEANIGGGLFSFVGGVFMFLVGMASPTLGILMAKKRVASRQ